MTINRSSLDPRIIKQLNYWTDLTDGGTDKDARAALCLKDRYYLLVEVCGRHDMLRPWIYDRCLEVQVNPNGFIDLWGREHYKSTIITFGGIIQEVLNDPEIRVSIFSHTRPIATAFLRSIKRELESNAVLKELFPTILYENPQREGASWGIETGITVKRKTNAKEATVEAHGLVDGQPTSKHFDLLVYDDVVTRESVSTPEQVQKTTEAWELSDNLGTEGGRKWIVGTRYSYADTYEAIIAKGSAKVRLRPATHDGTITGRPVLFTQETWDQKVRDQGEATIACQMLQNPLAGSQRMFDVTLLRVYEVRPETMNIYIMVDPARSKKQESDDTAMYVVGVDYALNKYLLDGYQHKMDLQERWRRVRELYRRWAGRYGIQSVSVGYEQYGAQADLDYLHERQRYEGPDFDIEELAWPRDGDGSKIDRVQRLGPDLRSGRIWLPYRTDADNLTRLQQRMVDQGNEHRIAMPIKRMDGEGKIYYLEDVFKIQLHYFPFSAKKDGPDAFSRIYDMEVSAPLPTQHMELEPSHV